MKVSDLIEALASDPKLANLEVSIWVPSVANPNIPLLKPVNHIETLLSGLNTIILTHD